MAATGVSTIFKPGTYEERLVCNRDLSEHSRIEVAEFLDRYIRQNAKSKIPEAWDRLVDSGPDDRLVNLIMDEASKVSDYAPAKHDVIAFLSSLQSLDAQSSFSTQSHSSPSLLSPESKSKEKLGEKLSEGLLITT